MLLDNGNGHNVISCECKNRLNLIMHQAQVALQGLGGATVMDKSEVSVELKMDETDLSVSAIVTDI